MNDVDDFANGNDVSPMFVARTTYVEKERGGVEPGWEGGEWRGVKTGSMT
jgi:hypothetical protein